MEVFTDIWNPLLEVTNKEILKFSSEFNTSWATTDNNHVQQTLNLIWILILESSCLTAIHYTSSNGLCIVDFL